jgi:MFS transporter, DHA1 family, multidrug resistance protein
MCWSLTLILSCSYATYFAFIGASSYLYINLLKFSPLSYAYIFIFLAAGYFVGNMLMMKLNKNGVDSTHIIKVGAWLNLLGVITLSFSLVVHSTMVLAIILTLATVLTRFSAAFLINPVQTKITNCFKELGAMALGLAICIEFALSGVAATVVGMFHLNSLLFGLMMISSLFAGLIIIGMFVVINTERVVSFE